MTKQFTFQWTRRIQDINALYSIFKECFPKHHFIKIDLLIEIWTLSKHYALIYDDEQRLLLGFIGYRYKGDHTHILYYGLKRMYKDKGLGTKILRAFLVELKEKQQLNDVTLCVNVNNYPARLVYKHVGFVDVKRLPQFYQHQEDGYEMKLDLN